MTIKANIKLKGGPGSGHHGHAGRPGKVGGSQPGKGGASLSREEYSGSKTGHLASSYESGSAKAGLVLLSNAIASRVGSTAEIANLRYRKYQAGFRLEDAGSYFGHMETTIRVDELGKYGFTLDSFSTYLDKFGAGKIKNRKRTQHFVYYD